MEKERRTEVIFARSLKMWGGAEPVLEDPGRSLILPAVSFPGVFPLEKKITAKRTGLTILPVLLEMLRNPWTDCF
jgi:hypothetical protein